MRVKLVLCKIIKKSKIIDHLVNYMLTEKRKSELSTYQEIHINK